MNTPSEYNINIISDTNPPKSPKFQKKQNTTLLSLNGNTLNKSSDMSLSPGSSRNYLMKSVFNHFLSPTAEREKNFMSPIQQYFNDVSLYEETQRNSFNHSNNGDCVFNLNNELADNNSTIIQNEDVINSTFSIHNTPNRNVNSNYHNRYNNHNAKPFKRIGCLMSSLHKMDYKEIAKQSYNLAKDQTGCRFLQKKIDDDPKKAINAIYPVILDHLLDTINDQFGNYLIQKFFEYLSPDELFQFTQMISPSFTNIGINQYGTRVVQKLMDYISNDKLYSTFVELLKPNIVIFSNDINGCHIIQKALFATSFDTNFIYDEMCDKIELISNHKNGCCFLQKSTEKLNGIYLERIITAIYNKAKILIVDQYGNYVIQHMMNMNSYERNRALFNMVINDIEVYANQKFSSNVIEKFFIYQDLTKEIINKLLSSQGITRKMLYNAYGNYVVQRAIGNASQEDQIKLLYLIAPLMEELKKYNFGLKLYHKLTSQYPILINLLTQF